MANKIIGTMDWRLSAGTTGLGTGGLHTDAGDSLGGDIVATRLAMIIPFLESSPPLDPEEASGSNYGHGFLGEIRENRVNTRALGVREPIAGFPTASAPTMIGTYALYHSDLSTKAVADVPPKRDIRSIVGYDDASGDFILNEGYDVEYSTNHVSVPSDQLGFHLFYNTHWVDIGPTHPGAGFRAGAPQVTGGLFEITPQMCAEGATLYRCIWWQHKTGGGGADTDRQQDNYRVYLELFDIGPCTVEICAEANTVHLPDAIADETTEPDLSLSYNGTQGHFSTPLSYASSDQPNVVFNASGTAGAREAVWIKLTIPPKTVAKSTCFCRIYTQGQNLGGDEAIAMAGFAWELPGYTPIYTLRKDRSITVGGGAKYKFTATVSETGEPADGLPILWKIEDTRSPTQADVGTLVAPDDAVTDENGEAFAIYHAPTTDGADDGDGPHLLVSVQA